MVWLPLTKPNSRLVSDERTLTHPPTFLVHLHLFSSIHAEDEGGQSDGQSNGNEDENGGEERQPTLEARPTLPP